MKHVTRQRQWQIFNVKHGYCSICGKRRIGKISERCDVCARKARIAQRKRRNHKPWQPGGRGRPPILPVIEDERGE